MHYITPSGPGSECETDGDPACDPNGDPLGAFCDWFEADVCFEFCNAETTTVAATDCDSEELACIGPFGNTCTDQIVMWCQCTDHE